MQARLIGAYPSKSGTSSVSAQWYTKHTHLCRYPDEVAANFAPRWLLEVVIHEHVLHVGTLRHTRPQYRSDPLVCAGYENGELGAGMISYSAPKKRPSATIAVAGGVLTAAELPANK